MALVDGSGKILLYVKTASGSSLFAPSQRLIDVVNVSAPLSRDVNEYVTSDNKYKSVGALDASISGTAAFDPASTVLATLLDSIRQQPPVSIDVLLVIGTAPGAGAENFAVWYEGRLSQFELSKDAEDAAEYDFSIEPLASPPASQIQINQTSFPTL